MRKRILLMLALASVSQYCFHGYEARLFKLQIGGANDRTRLIDDFHRLLIETERCSVLITPAYLGPLVFWIEESPLRPCDELALIDLAVSGQAIGEPISQLVYSDEEPIGGAFPFEFVGAAQAEFNVKWAGVPDSKRLFKAELEIELEGEPIHVMFQAVSIEPKWLVARPYWKTDR